MKLFSLYEGVRVSVWIGEDNSIESIGVFAVKTISSKAEFVKLFNRALSLMMNDDGSFVRLILSHKESDVEVAEMFWDSDHEYFDGSFREDMKLNEDGDNFGLDTGSIINEIVSFKIEGVD